LCIRIKDWGKRGAFKRTKKAGRLKKRRTNFGGLASGGFIDYILQGRTILKGGGRLFLGFGIKKGGIKGGVI